MASSVKPKTSVIIPAHNAGGFIADAIKSILNQTAADFELIVVNDGSTDDTAARVRAFTDKRLRLIEQANQGVAAARNCGIRASRGDYLAFLDSDDIAMPMRLEKQVAYLTSQPSVGLVGTAAEIWENNLPTGRFYRHPCWPPELAFAMLFENYLVQSSVMVRRKVIDEIGLYTELESRRHEDFELWSRVGRRYAMANLPDVLVAYRVHPGSICDTRNFDANGTRRASENVAHASGSLWVRPHHQALAALMRGQQPTSRSKYAVLSKLLERLSRRIEKRFEQVPGALDNALALHRDNLRHHWERFYGPVPEESSGALRQIRREL
jgi:glycosyltransferase involved in cell wall biosynthesis